MRGLLTACDHSPLLFTSGPFCRGAAYFPNPSRILPKDTKAVILPALKKDQPPKTEPIPNLIALIASLRRHAAEVIQGCGKTVAERAGGRPACGHEFSGTGAGMFHIPGAFRTVQHL